MFFTRNNRNVSSAGFTAIEVIVVLSIFSIMAGVSTFNFRAFQREIGLSNSVYDAALLVQQAKAYGLAAANTTNLAGRSGDLVQNRGVHFPAASDPQPHKITIFADTDGSRNLQYDAPGTSRSDQILDIFRLKNFHSITEVCWIPLTSTTETCSDDAEVSVAFRRPSPEANITVVNRGSAVDPRVVFVRFGDQTKNRSIAVHRNGLIEVL